MSTESQPGVAEQQQPIPGAEKDPLKDVQNLNDRENTSFVTVALISFMIAVMTSGLMLMGYDHFLAKKFLVVDVKGYIEVQQELYLAGKLTDDQLKQNYVALKEAVAKIPANRIVLMGDAVLGGAEKLEIVPTTK